MQRLETDESHRLLIAEDIGLLSKVKKIARMSRCSARTRRPCPYDSSTECVDIDDLPRKLQIAGTFSQCPRFVRINVCESAKLARKCLLAAYDEPSMFRLMKCLLWF